MKKVKHIQEVGEWNVKTDFNNEYDTIVNELSLKRYLEDAPEVIKAIQNNMKFCKQKLKELK